MNITEQFGFGVAIMVYKHPLKQALRDLHAAIDRWDAPLAKLAGLTGELQKLLSGDLRKDAIGYTEESNRICKAAIAELEGLNDVLREATAASARMQAALPSYEAWALPRQDRGAFRTVDKAELDAAATEAALHHRRRTWRD